MSSHWEFWERTPISAIFDPFWPPGDATRFFNKYPGMLLFLRWVVVTSCKISEKSNEQSLRILRTNAKKCHFGLRIPIFDPFWPPGGITRIFIILTNDAWIWIRHHLKPLYGKKIHFLAKITNGGGGVNPKTPRGSTPRIFPGSNTAVLDVYQCDLAFG